MHIKYRLKILSFSEVFQNPNICVTVDYSELIREQLRSDSVAVFTRVIEYCIFLYCPFQTPTG